MPDVRTQARQKVTLHDQRHEVQAELQCGGLNANARIGYATRHTQGDGNVGVLGMVGVTE
jgi:hypothetical protein